MQRSHIDVVVIKFLILVVQLYYYCVLFYETQISNYAYVHYYYIIVETRIRRYEIIWNC